MSTLDSLIELQSIHENLRIIHRDLSNFPPDLTAQDADLKKQAKRKDQLAKDIDEAEKRIETLSGELKLALRLEEHARAALKQTTQKAQYTAAIRELDERERHRTSIARPLKETEVKLASMKVEMDALLLQLSGAQSQYDELHDIFLSEHENQVIAREKLSARLVELEAIMDGSELTRFNKLMQQRHGRAVVAVDNGNCDGCRTKIRGPLLSQIRDKGYLPCETCQRILYIKSK